MNAAGNSAPRSKFLLQPASLAWKFGPGWDSKVLCSGDIDGDGRDEVLINITQPISPYGCLAVVSYLQMSDLDAAWANHEEPRFAVQWAAPAGIPQWMYPTGAGPRSLDCFSYFAMDLDGDGADEVVAFCPSVAGVPPALGVLKWLDQKLTCVWQGNGTVPGATGGSYPLTDRLQAYAAKNLDGSGGVSLVVLQPGASLAVLKMANGALQCTWSAQSSLPGAGGVTAWSFSGNDRLILADLDGDGRDEIILYAPGYANSQNIPGAGLGVAKWGNAGLTVLEHLSGSQPSPPDFVKNLYQIQVADFGRTGVVKIAIVTGTDNLFALAWQNQTLATVWHCNGSVPGVSGGPTLSLIAQHISLFNLNPQNFYVLDPDGRGPALFAVSQPGIYLSAYIVQWQNGGFVCTYGGNPQTWGLNPGCTVLPLTRAAKVGSIFCFAPGASAALLTFQASAGEPVPISIHSVLTCVFQAQTVLPAWNLDFLVRLPGTSFTPFVGAQLKLYQAISLALTPPAVGPDEQTGDLRYQYTNLNDANTFSAWATQIKDMPVLGGYTQTDWDAVAPLLSAEVGWVGLDYGLRANMIDLAGAIQAQQDLDLNHCFGNMGLDQSSSTAPVSYWAGAVIDAALWGIAATPIGWGAQACVAIVASLFGSWANEPVSAPPTTSVKYLDFKSKVDSLYLEAIQGTYLSLSAIVTDPVKLRVTGQLLEVPWDWKISDPSSVCPNGSNQNRVMFYQMMIGAEFNLFTWFGSSDDGPTTVYMDPQQNCWSQPIPNIPSWAKGNFKNGDGSYNVWLLAQGTLHARINGWDLVAFPKQVLMTDLFSTLGVNSSDVMNGNYGWNKLPSGRTPVPEGCQSLNGAPIG